jgi:methionine aminotransferase
VQIVSKLPHIGTNIFTIMSGLAAQHGAVNLSQGFPNFDPSGRLRRLVTEAMAAGHNQYAPMPGLLALRQQIAAKIARLYSVETDPDTEITITAGGTQAIFSIILAVVHPGDEVILLEPCYDSYRPSVEAAGGIPVAYTMTAPDFSVDWQALGSLITPRTRLICINTPGNPTGTILTGADMQALEQIVEGTSIAVMSDEVYEHLIYDGVEHASVLRYPALRSRSFAVYSFGKTCHCTGWKIGYCVAPPALTAEFRKIHQFNVFSVHHPMQVALAEFLQDPQEYLGLPAFYQQKRDFFADLMQGTAYRPLPCAGTYFQVYDYSAISREGDLDFCKRLTTDFGVASIPVSAFYSDGRDQHLIRVCFAKTEEVLKDGAQRLAVAAATLQT